MNSNNPEKPKSPKITKSPSASRAPEKTNNPQAEKVNSSSEEEIPVVSTFIKPATEKNMSSAKGYFKLAMANYMLTKDLKKGIQLLEFGFATDPLIKQAYEYEFGLKISENGKIEKGQAEKLLVPFALDIAIKRLKHVTTLDPEFVDAYYNLGICYIEKYQVEQAVKAFRKVLELDTDPKSVIHESARFNLGNQLVLKREYIEAVEQFEKILETDPNVLDSLYNAAYIYFKHLKDYDKAIKYFDRTLKVFNLHLDARYNLGLCYYLKEDKEKAIEIWEQLVRVYSSHGPAYFNLALTHKELGRKDKARLFYQKYLEIPVKDPGQLSYAKTAKRRLKQLQEDINSGRV